MPTLFFHNYQPTVRRYIILSLTLMLSVLSACQGGELATPDVWPTSGEFPSAGTPVIEMGGEVGSGMQDDMAGDQVDQTSGTPAEDCGIYSSSSRETFVAGPLPFIASTCVDAGCHNLDFPPPDGFKLSFTSPDGSDGFSERQVTEALTIIEPRVTLGDGENSILAGRVIDRHAIGGDFTDDHAAIVSWINTLACE